MKTYVFNKMSKIKVDFTNKIITAVYIKILTNYLQIISSISTFDLDIPSGFISFPN